MPLFPAQKAVFGLFGYCAGLARSPVLVLILAITPLIMGCGSAEKRDDRKAMEPYASQAAGVFALDESPSGSPVEPTWWSVLVSAVPSGRMDDAERLLETVHATGLTGAYIAIRDKRPVIAFGRYTDPADPQAQQGLQRVRQTDVGGVTPFGAAMLLPPATVRAGADSDEINLRTVRQRMPKRDAAYTLQVGVFGRQDLGRPTPEELRLYQREAEQAARRYRSQGEQAFYFHGPNMSMVTIGVFSEEDHDGSTQPPIESIRLRQTRQNHPYNLLNGEGIRETVRTETGSVKRLQASRLVAIPDR